MDGRKEKKKKNEKSERKTKYVTQSPFGRQPDEKPFSEDSDNDFSYFKSSPLVSYFKSSHLTWHERRAGFDSTVCLNGFVLSSS